MLATKTATRFILWCPSVGYLLSWDDKLGAQFTNVRGSARSFPSVGRAADAMRSMPDYQWRIHDTNGRVINQGE